MIKVRNEKITFTIKKGDKVLKTFDIKNRLTDLYLDYVLDKTLDMGIVTDNDAVEYFMSTAYLKFNTTQTITDSSTTMDYDLKSYPLLIDDIQVFVNENSKKVTSTYFFDFTGIVPGDQFMGIGFGRNDLDNTDYLLAFIDLSLVDLYYEDGVAFLISRVDEIVSNEISTTAAYLTTGYQSLLKEVRLVYPSGGKDIYPIDSLTLTRVSPGYATITQLPNYVIEEGLYPAEDLYPEDGVYETTGGVASFRIVEKHNDYTYTLSEEAAWGQNILVGDTIRGLLNGEEHYFTITEVLFEDYDYKATSTRIYEVSFGTFTNAERLVSAGLYPEEAGAIEKVEFYYEDAIGNNYTTYIPIKDLDTSYDDTNMYINFKIERGEY